MIYSFLGEKNHFHINLNDEVVRGSIILDNGKWLWPPPAPTGPPPPPPKKVAVVKEEQKAVSPFNATLNNSLATTAGK